MIVEVVGTPAAWAALCYLDPLGGSDAPRGDLVAHLVVEDLGRRPRKRPDSGLGKPANVLRDADPRAHRAVQHLFGREAVNVQVRQLSLERFRQVDVQPSFHLRRQPCLHAHLGGPQIPGLPCTSYDLPLGQEIALLGAVVAAESAESRNA